MTESIREPASSGLPSAFALEKLFARDFYRPAMGLSPLSFGEYFKNSDGFLKTCAYSQLLTKILKL